MDNGMESMLDTYLFETNSLLDNLDEMLMKDEKLGDFSPDDVNEIFRIMHTIKGSSAMMEFGSLSSIAHHIEDLFFYIRDKGIDSLDPQHKKELFNLMFRSEDCLRGEVEKVENGQPLETDLDGFVAEINNFLKKISGAATEEPEPNHLRQVNPARFPKRHLHFLTIFPMTSRQCALFMYFWMKVSEWKTFVHL